MFTRIQQELGQVVKTNMLTVQPHLAEMKWQQRVQHLEQDGLMHQLILNRNSLTCKII